MSIEAILWRPNGQDEEVDFSDSTRRRLSKEELLWVDCESPSEDERESITKALGLSDGAAEALADEPRGPGARVLEGAAEIIVLPLPDREEIDAVVLQILIGREWIITRHDEPLPFLDEHRERLRDEREVGRLEPVEFLVTLLDWHVDTFFAAADDLEHKVDELDDAALRRDDDLLRTLVAMRRRIARVRRIVGRHREVFAELTRPDFLADLNERQSRAISHEAERLTRASEAIAHVREMLIGTFDVHMTRTAQRTNDIMRVLTWASVILLPAAVLAGIMGMNFKLDFFANPTFFWIVIGFMVLLATSTLLVARWRGWL